MRDTGPPSICRGGSSDSPGVDRCHRDRPGLFGTAVTTPAAAT